MNKQTAQELLMDYLYDEISDTDKRKLEAYIADHPELQQELEELRETRSIMQKAPEVTPDNQISVVDTDHDDEDRASSFKQFIPSSKWMRRSLAAAACIALLLVSAAVADVSMQSTQNGFAIYFGGAVSPQSTGLTEAQTEAIVQRIQTENTAMMTEYADMLNKHNQQQLQQVVAYFERQRLNDLQVIDQAFNQYQEKTEDKLQQTNQVLGEFLQTVAVNDHQ